MGEGQDKTAFEELTHQLDLSGQIHFTGWISPKLIPSYMAAGDIFIGPSRTSVDGWIEAQGLTFLEAMAARTPVIATRMGGIIDTVKHKKTGLLVDERSPDQISSAVIKLTEDETLKNKIISNGYSLSSTFFSRAYSARSFSMLFEDLIHTD